MAKRQAKLSRRERRAPDSAAGVCIATPRRFVTRLIAVAAGIVLGQAILYGPSLLGRKILLPLDHLEIPSVYVPRTGASNAVMPHNFVRSDLILVFEPLRRFTAQEMAAGRSAVWTPYQYAGTPMPFGKYSPMWVLRSFVQSPVIIAWMQLLISLSIGFGAYVFCREVMQASFWPAAVAAWCYPVTGFFVFWEGYPVAWVAGWLPWLLWAIDKTARRPAGWGGPVIALVTYLAVADRHLDIAGQVLLASGIFALYRLFALYGRRWFSQGFFGRPTQAAAAVAAGWALGLLLAAPCLMPTLEYAQTGFRTRHRAGGGEERPPIGLAALPQTVLPDMYGSTQKGSVPFFPEGQGNQLESSAAAYTGLLATLFAAPLAFTSRRHRASAIFFSCLGFFALGWCLNVPGIVHILRLPGLNLMSHNRFVFVTSFAILVLAAMGLDVLWRDEVQRRSWFWFWFALSATAVLLVWCLHRAAELPEPLANEMPASVRRGGNWQGVADEAGVLEAQTIFVRSYVTAAVLSAFAVAGWLLLWFRTELPAWFLPLLASLLVGDLLVFAHNRSAQCDPSLYYPEIPALREVTKAEPGRIIGSDCLPALLNHVYRVGDIRGDDGVEPARMIELSALAADPASFSLEYAVTQWLSPRIAAWPPEEFRLSPLLDMLNVRYVVFRGTPPSNIKPDFASPDYWVLVNRHALPRVYVPERVETVSSENDRLARLSADDFLPRRVAFLEEPVHLPETCRGSAGITGEVPTSIRVSLDMQTPGLLVLADRWDAGWRAYLNGNAVPVLRTNHALRGVVVPAGKGTLEFRYEPAGVAVGLRLCGAALLGAAAWLFLSAARHRFHRPRARNSLEPE